MLAEESSYNIICPTEEELVEIRHPESSKCPAAECGKVILNPGGMKMHLAQTHGIGEESVLQMFNKAHISKEKTVKSVYACPVFTCNRTYGTGKYFKAMSGLRQKTVDPPPIDVGMTLSEYRINIWLTLYAITTCACKRYKLSSLGQHYLSLHAEKKYVCEKCGVKFGNPKRHEMHTKACKEFFHCSCGCPFKKREALLEHSAQEQHVLPEEIRIDLLKRNEEKVKRQRASKQRISRAGVQILAAMKNSQNQSGGKAPTNFTSGMPQNKKVLLLPKPDAMNQMTGANAFLVIPNMNKTKLGQGKSVSSFCDDGVNVRPSMGVKVVMDMKDRVQNTVQSDAAKQSETYIDSSVRNMQVEISMGSVNSRGSSCFDKGVRETGLIGTNKTVVGSNSSNQALLKQAEANEIVSREKLKRVNEAMQRFVPIKKRDPTDPVSLHWHLPRRKYRKKVKLKPKESSRYVDNNRSDDEASVSAIQNCLLQATKFVESALPAEESDSNDMISQDDSHKIVHEATVTENTKLPEGDVLKQRTEKSFERHAVSVETIDDTIPRTENQRLEKITKPVNKQATKLTGLTSDEQIGEFSLDNLPPELLSFLKSSVDIQHQSKNIYTNMINEMNSQETQTPVKVGSNQFSFDNNYTFLGHFDNNDIQTQTEDLSNFLSDAFTQTNQQAGKVLPTANTKQLPNISDTHFSTQTAASWLSSNQTQTDNMAEFISDAFTQTRLAFSENDSKSRNLTNNISNNQTQTNLSFDNFLKSFSFGPEDEVLESTIMPDFTDMCTQTNPDPSFDELLGMATAAAQTISSIGNVASSSSQTQTVLSFDDIFGGSLIEEDLSTDRHNSSAHMQTQTQIIDDMFLTDSFTQTPLPI